jgi:hypothetical protein
VQRLQVRASDSKSDPIPFKGTRTCVLKLGAET